MPQFYPTENFGFGTVSTAPSPADSGTSLVLSAGEGARFPDPATDGSYPVTIYPTSAQPVFSNSEVFLVTAKSSDTLTITRAQEGTNARTVVVGDKVAMTISREVGEKLHYANWKKVTQTTHGFAAKDVIYFNGTVWAKARADALSTMGTHLVAEVFNANNFAAVSIGAATIATHGLTLGTVYYLSTSSAGTLTSTEPTSGYRQPILIPETSSIVNVIARPGIPVAFTRNALMPGMMLNGKFSVTVSASDLIVAVKTLAGSDPSASDPVFVQIGDNVRAITAALGKTLADGTNWFAAGTAPLATLELDYFLYFGYNATDGVTLGYSRLMDGIQYSSFSTTTTAATYAAISTITNAQASDVYVNAGRFSATLSAGAAYTWSNANTVISRPITTKKYEIYKSLGYVQAYLGTNQGVVAATPEKLELDTEEADFGSNFASSTYTMPAPGKLTVLSNARFAVGADGDSIQVSIYVNGSEVRTTPIRSSGTANQSVGIQATLVLKTSDTVEVWVNNGTTNDTILSGSTISFASFSFEPL